jgi:phosphoribosylamine--glycine ligase
VTGANDDYVISRRRHDPLFYRVEVWRPLKILIIGGGGREHAIAWQLAGYSHVICAAPGNPGIAQLGRVIPTSDYLAAAKSFEPDLTIVGPEAPLVAGVVDQFRAEGLPIIGPTRQMAQLEASKIYSKEFMRQNGIPTARFVRVENEADALRALAEFGEPVVIKADGLAGGKGVVVARDRAEAEGAIGSLGPRLIIEEFLSGEEVSFIAVCDGENVVPLEATQDHKTIGDGDTGPNTGGMGAYCDGRILTPAESDQIVETVIRPAVEATRFTGFLYAGLMMTANGPKVLEFNVRLGDPETQVLMHRIASDFASILAQKDLRNVKLDWRVEPSVCVVAAAAGYPGTPRTGDSIDGIDGCGADVFQAGTRRGAKGLETAGGRVLGVTARGPDLASAIHNTYAAMSKIHFEGMHYRRDIASKGLKRWGVATIGR